MRVQVAAERAELVNENHSLRLEKERMEQEVKLQGERIACQ
jgi:hypothetical protein